MKAFGSLIALLVLLTISAHAQARKLEVVPYTNADNEQAYLDLLAIALHEDPSSRGVLIGYRKSDLSPGIFLRRVYGYQNYLTNMRGVGADRIQILEGDVKPETFTEMWLVPPGVASPIADSKLNLVPNLPLKFDVAFPDCWSEMTVYLEDLGDSLRFYARALLANPDVSAKIVAYPDRRASVRKVAHMAAQARSRLIANYHIDSRRISTTVRNRRRVCTQLELWLK